MVKGRPTSGYGIPNKPLLPPVIDSHFKAIAASNSPTARVTNKKYIPEVRSAMIPKTAAKIAAIKMPAGASSQKLLIPKCTVSIAAV